MKKVFSILMLSMATLGFVACGDSSESLSASKAKKLFAKEMKRLNATEVAATVQTGYFECNDESARYKLRQLAANDIVTYKCERVMRDERVRKSRRVQRGYYFTYWDTEYYYTTEQVPTYFVTVSLTEKGRQLVYESPEVEPDEDTKELKKDLEIDYSAFPESSVAEVEFPEENAAEVTETEAVAEEEVVVEEDYESPADAPAPAKQPEKSDYEKAKARENVEPVELLAYNIDIVKARNVHKTGDFTAKAQILMEYKDVTPVGRIYRYVYNGQRFLANDINYTYYEDKGWRLNVNN